jgi:hypothetical protein
MLSRHPHGYISPAGYLLIRAGYAMLAGYFAIGVYYIVRSIRERVRKVR